MTPKVVFQTRVTTQNMGHPAQKVIHLGREDDPPRGGRWLFPKATVRMNVMAWGNLDASLDATSARTSSSVWIAREIGITALAI